MTAMALELDFKRRPVSRWQALGWLALVLAVLAVVAASAAYSDAEQAHALAQSRHAHLLGRFERLDNDRAPAPPDAQTLATIRRANLVIDQLALPWAGLFDAVEAADARGLGLLSLTPNARDRSFRLVGESRSMDELLGYVGRMAAQPGLRQVHLLGYGPAMRDGVPVVAFTLAASWR